MRRARLAILTLLAVPALTGLAAPQVPAGSPTADQLVAKVIEVRRETGFRIRATMTRTTLGSGVRDVRQLLIKGRREQRRLFVLYQQLWPEFPGGRALVIEDTGSHQLNGFQLESGRVTPLSNSMLGRRFFDSDITLEDMAENFWYWPERSLGGEENVGEYHTVVVNLRPGPSTPSTYSLVRTWLAPDLALGLRSKLYDHAGGLAKTVSLYRILKFDDRWVPGIVTVEPSDQRSRTVIEGLSREVDVPVSRSEFTPAAVRKALAGPAP